MIRPKKRPPLHKGQTEKPAAVPHVFPAPVRGWHTEALLAEPEQGVARVLDNFIPRANGIEMRKGTVEHATTGDPVISLWTYSSGGVSEMFAATETAIYDVTSAGTSVPSAAVSSQTAGDYSVQQFGTTGGDFLYVVNGSDDPQVYDGSTWAVRNGGSTPSLSGSGLTVSDLDFVWSYASRLFFIEKDTTNVWYLAADSVGGTLNRLVLSSIFTKGGTLLWGATWSLDAGDGLDDKWVVCSSEGEVAVYSGTDPSTASNWSLQGVYKLPRPLGRHAFLQVAGDILIATEDGLLSLSQATQTDSAQLEETAISNPIRTYWQDKAGELSKDWRMAKVEADGFALITQPLPVGVAASQGRMLVINTQTLAWARFTGLNADCITVLGDKAYFGSDDGWIYQMQTRGNDDGAAYTCTYIGAHESLGAYGQEKTILQMRGLFDATTPFSPSLTVLSDYDVTAPSAPAAAADFSLAVWDAAIWDTDEWDAVGDRYSNRARWVSIGKTGIAVAPVLQITSNSTPAPDVTLVSIEAECVAGARVA